MDTDEGTDEEDTVEIPFDDSDEDETGGDQPGVSGLPEVPLSSLGSELEQAVQDMSSISGATVDIHLNSTSSLLGDPDFDMENSEADDEAEDTHHETDAQQSDSPTRKRQRSQTSDDEDGAARQNARLELPDEATFNGSDQVH